MNLPESDNYIHLIIVMTAKNTTKDMLNMFKIYINEPKCNVHIFLKLQILETPDIQITNFHAHKLEKSFIFYNSNL